MNRFLACIVAAASLFAYQANGQSPGAGAAQDDQPVRGHQYVVAIGIDHYQNWPVLGTAVNDATGFGELLVNRFGYEYGARPLTDQNATRENINALVGDELLKKLKPEDDLILFFAGHGTTRTMNIGGETESAGFLVPYEARAPGASEHWSDYVKIEEFLREVSRLPAKHILVILDSCPTGIALESKSGPSGGDGRFGAAMLRKMSRTVITSAGSDQLASETGPIPDHSLFAGVLMQGLATGKADVFGEGFVTASQLGAYVQHAVSVVLGSKQTPGFGRFDMDEGGELIIHLLAAGGAGGKNSILAPL